MSGDRAGIQPARVRAGARGRESLAGPGPVAATGRLAMRRPRARPRIASRPGCARMKRRSTMRSTCSPRSTRGVAIVTVATARAACVRACGPCCRPRCPAWPRVARPMRAAAPIWMPCARSRRHERGDDRRDRAGAGRAAGHGPDRCAPTRPAGAAAGDRVGAVLHACFRRRSRPAPAPWCWRPRTRRPRKSPRWRGKAIVLALPEAPAAGRRRARARPGHRLAPASGAGAVARARRRTGGARPRRRARPRAGLRSAAAALGPGRVAGAAGGDRRRAVARDRARAGLAGRAPGIARSVRPRGHARQHRSRRSFRTCPAAPGPKVAWPMRWCCAMRARRRVESVALPLQVSARRHAANPDARRRPESGTEIPAALGQRRRRPRACAGQPRRRHGRWAIARCPSMRRRCAASTCC